MGKRGVKPTPLEERFWSKVEKTPTCWLWKGAHKIGKDAYGFIHFNGKLISTHRASWQMVNGPIPENMCILHSCDNPPCVNPAHLRIGTRRENSMDMVNRNRHPTLLNAKSKIASKFTEKKILEIRDLKRKKPYLSYASIARTYKVTPTAISFIIRRHVWKNI